MVVITSVSSLQHLSRWSALVAIFASFFLACALARALPSDLTLLIFFLPIWLLIHNIGPVCAYGFCPLAVLAWRSLQHPLALTWNSFWSISVFSLFLGLLSLAAYRLQLSSRQLRDQQRQLTAFLPLCPNCGHMLCHDGQWRSFEQLLQKPPLVGSLPHHPCVHTPLLPGGTADYRE